MADNKVFRLYGDVPKLAVDSIVTDYVSYKGTELKIGIVNCSNKLVPIVVDYSSSALYIDLENGNIYPGYTPGGENFLLDNLISFFKGLGYELYVSNMVYWIEAYCFGEVTLLDLGGKMAENIGGSSFVKMAILQKEDKNEISAKLMCYLQSCKALADLMRSAFGKNASRYRREINMMGKYTVYWKKTNTHLYMIMSYLRARNKDYEALYCRENDTYYVSWSNRHGVNGFTGKDSIVRALRDMFYLSGRSYVSVVGSRDLSPLARLHDFTLDLEKLGQVMKKI